MNGGGEMGENEECYWFTIRVDKYVYNDEIKLSGRPELVIELSSGDLDLLVSFIKDKVLK